MEKLMGIDSDYWNTFLGKDEGEDLYRDSRYAVLNFLAILKIAFQVPLSKHPGYPPIFHIQVDF